MRKLSRGKVVWPPSSYDRFREGSERALRRLLWEGGSTRPRLLGQVRGADREGAQSRRSRGISRLHPHLGQIREVDEEGEVAARLLRKVAEIEEVVMRLVLLARVVPHHLQRLEHRVVVAREVGDARADGVDRPVAACERRRRRRPPVLEAEYANLRARIRYCAAYSEHGVTTPERGVQ